MADAKRPDLVSKALACWKAADTADDAQLKREKRAMGFYAGGDNQWSEAAIKARDGRDAIPASGAFAGVPAVNARPRLTINKLRAPVRSLLNQERNAHMGASLIPADDFGTGVPDEVEKEIELREGLYRRIQRESDAMAAHSWCFDRVAQAGRGFWRVLVEPASDRTFDLDVKIARIYNQSAVRLDPSHVEPDGSDARWALIAADMSEEAYKQEFPESEVTAAVGADGFTGMMSEAPDWFSDTDGQKSIRVVEYFYTTYQMRTLCWFNNQPVWKEQLPVGVKAEGPPDPVTGRSTKPRVVNVPQVKWAKLNGVEVLQEEDWAGRYIPVIKELGEELQPFNSDRQSDGLVQPSISSQEGFNFMASELVFSVGQATKAPLMATREQIEGYEPMYEAAAVMPMPYLLYNAVSEAGQLLGPPTPTDRNVPIQHIAFGLNTFAQAIHDTTGVPSASLGDVDPTLKSGRAILALQKQAQQTTSNFLDNHARSIRHEARVVNDLLLPVYGNRPGRVVQIQNEQGEMETATLGDPNGPKLTDREFTVVVKVGKNYDTRNEEGSAFMVEALGGQPVLMAPYMDILFGMQSFPGAKVAQKRAKMLLPPNIQQAEAQEGQDPQAQLQQLKGQLDQTSKMAEALTQRVKEQQIAIEADTVKQAGETERKRLDIASNERIAAIKAHTELIKTEATINGQAATTMLKGEIDRILQGLEDQHELLVGRQSHDQALEQQTQQAALAPPEATEGEPADQGSA